MRRRERAQAVVWLAVMMPLFLSIIGLAIDGGIAFDARRSLQNLADGAARAGATRLDVQALRASNGSSVVLDPGEARQAATAYLAAQAPGVDAAVNASAQQVVVHVSRQVPTAFLRIVGMSAMHITATAPAEVRYGIASGGR